MPRKWEYQDLTGLRFNRLTVVSLAKRTPRRRYLWLCKCDCGNEVVVSGEHLRSNHTKSCGCLNNDIIGNLNYKHGLSNTKLYYAYYNMIHRCTLKDNNEFANYGGRGITVCKEWMGKDGFSNFAEWSLANGYSDGLTIDRKDNDKGYSPDNCRWVDRYVQANNKRTTRYIKVNGETDTVANMARKHGISYWNLLCYSKGGKNCKYPELKIEVADIVK